MSDDHASAAIQVSFTQDEASVVVPALRLYQEVIGHGLARLDASQESYSTVLGHIIDAMMKVEDAQRAARKK